MSTVIKKEVKNNLKESIQELIAEMGGIEKYISKGDRVLVKPNFNTADPFPASTDPKFLKHIVEFIYEAGAKEVIIGESSTFSQNSTKNIQKLGVDQFEKEMDPAPKVLDFDTGKRIKKDIPNAQFMKKVALPEVLDEVDKIVWLPCLKTHFLAQFTGALKLVIGLTNKKYKLLMHTGHLQEKFVEVNTLFKPDLIIMDGRKCFITGGPANGELREPNVLLGSTNRVAIDIEGIKVIQSYDGNSLSNIEAEELPQIKWAQQIGIE